MEDKTSASQETELTEYKSRTFYTTIKNQMVYVTVTVQEIPIKVETHDTYMSIGDYIKKIAALIDELSWLSKGDPTN